MKIWKWLLIAAFIAASGFVTVCGDDDDDDDDSNDDGSDDDADDDVIECYEGELWDEELGECIPEECGLDRYPNAPFDDKALIYVDASYAGDSDGSTEKPFKTITEALANAGEKTSILIAAGDYAEAVTFKIELDGLDLIGRCSYLTKVRSAKGLTALIVDEADSNLVSKISFFADEKSDDEIPIIYMHEAINIKFIENSVSGSTYCGLHTSYCDGISISKNVFSGNTDMSIFLSYTNNGVISDNEVCDTRANEQGKYGRGIEVQDSKGVLVSANVIEGNVSSGILFSRADGTISGNQIQDNLGRGIGVQYAEQILVSNNIVENNAETGIFAAFSNGAISGNEIRLNFGRGINIQDSGQILVSDNLVEYNTKASIFFSRANGLISGNQILDNLDSGINVQDSEGVSISDNVVEGNTGVGIVFGTSNGAIFGNEVRGTLPDSPNENGYTFGHGIQIQDSNDVECSYNIVENNIHAGILYISSGGDISENQVSETMTESKDSFDYGDGIIVIDNEGFISIQDNTLDSNDRCGILADSSTGMIERNGIFGNENSIVAQNDSDMNVSDNDIHDNDIDIVQFFEGRELEVNDSMIEMN